MLEVVSLSISFFALGQQGLWIILTNRDIKFLHKSKQKDMMLLLAALWSSTKAQVYFDIIVNLSTLKPRQMWS